ncbi:zinc-dependent metalloprotease [Singulisphaera sp. PoT]|uniref:zinc-dependent metalloprotease n=1 Tax=Singulisphaera sp. PoT TaxID=3411797 RepID=UPI003BF5A912
MRRILTMTSIAALALAIGPVGLLRAIADDKTVEGDHETHAAKGRPSGPGGGDGEKKYRDFDDVIKGAEHIDGLFTLYHKDDNLYAEIKTHQFEQPMLAPIAIARGMAMAGQPLNFGDEWVLLFKRVGDRVQLIRRNIHYKAPSGSPLERAVKQNYTDSVLMGLPVQSVHPRSGSVLINLSDIFFTDFADLGFGFVDRSRTNWHKIKGFANNLELEVETTFGGGNGRYMSYFGDDGVIDSRGRTIVIHYSLAKLPESGYHARYADDRVGHFLSAVKDFGLTNPDTSFVRQINRWRIEKSDSKAKLSPPKKQLIWYVESNVPLEYRPFVEAGILEWNKAFEKIGIRNALAVRWQEEGRDDFDPEDINYCTFRWITTGNTFAMSALRANPLTGEMIDGDVIFDASWIKYWKEQYAFLTGSLPVAAQDSKTVPLAIGQVISPMMAAKQGFGLPFQLPNRRAAADINPTTGQAPEAIPAEWNGLQVQLRKRQASGLFSSCQYSVGMRPEMGLAAIALAEKEGDAKDKDKEKDEEPKLPEEFLGQMIKEVVMHEVGHSLGLRHNFKASTMLNPDQINDTAITRVKGQSGSVMDYNPINIVPKGQKQGDYVTTTLGPYDYWAIEYAYKPIDGDEASELKKIAARSPEADLVFGTDEDMYLNNDPYVNTYDLSSDTLRFSKDRILLAAELLKGLDDKVVKDGESWSRAREAFSILLQQWGNAAFMAASHIGGQSVSRDHKGTKGERDPMIPVKGAKQREALAFLVEQILSDRAFKFSPALMRRVTTERWSHWGDDSLSAGAVGTEFPLHERVLRIQSIVISECLAPEVLSRLLNQELQTEGSGEALKIAEVFRTLTDGVWSEVAAGKPDEKGANLTLSTIRRNLQREHLRKLCTIVLGNRRASAGDAYAYILFSSGGASYPADAKSLARLHLKDIGNRIDATLARKELTIDDTTRAHLEESKHRIAKVLDAGIESNEP